MITTYLLLAASFVLLLGGAFIFTNAIEWAGARLDLGHGAVGSILAAVATALPESMIPIIAIIGGGATGQIAIGAIIGAPFLLGTLAMALVGVSALGFRGRRQQGAGLRLDRATMQRDLIVFLAFLGIALVLGLVSTPVVSIVAAVVFVLAYAGYVWRTIVAGREAGGETEELQDLFFDPSKQDPPTNLQVVIQSIVGLGLIVGGAHLFVTEIEHLGHALGISALVLALVLAPLASELPEKVNSFLWVRTGKDSLALGNITGAMVFQSMIPVAVGLAFTDWKLTGPAAIAAACALVGGAVCLLAIRFKSRFSLPFVGVWAVLYFGAVAYIISSA